MFAKEKVNMLKNDRSIYLYRVWNIKVASEGLTEVLVVKMTKKKKKKLILTLYEKKNLIYLYLFKIQKLCLLIN